jgi:hypothetical protein
MYNLKERITSDNLLEGALLVVVACLAIKIFEPLFTVAFFVAAGIVVYLGIRNREKLKTKIANLIEYIKSAR